MTHPRFHYRPGPLCAALALAACAAPAGAQDASSGNWALEEVVVTAQKRAQSSQDLGLSVSALNGDALREQGIAQVEDLARFVPNVSSLNISGGGVPIVIVRGVGLQNFRVNDSPTTALYIDEVYQTSVISADFTMFDLERVELLKGPQGGLYGRNSISGAMQVISNKPYVGEPAGGYLNAEYGRYNRRQLEGAASFPLNDTAAMRVSGRWEQSDDTQFKSQPGGFHHGEADRWAARSLLRLEPGDNVDILFKVHGGADQSELPLLQPVGTFADLGTAADAGLDIANADNIALGSLIPALCPSLLAGRGVNGDCVYNTGGRPSDYGLDGGRYQSAADFGGYLDNTWYGASINANLALGDYTLTSISAYDNIDYRRDTDLDGLPIEHTHSDYRTQIDSWSQEFRVAFDDSDTVSWVAGLTYGEDELVEASDLRGSEGLLPVAFGGAQRVDQNYEQTTRALALYAHGEWRFSPQWNLVAELRHTNADKQFEGLQVLDFGSFAAPFISYDDDTDFDNLSGKLALEWTPADNLLFYGSLSEGFKTGGFYGGFITAPEQLAPYDEETILAYEAGLKSDWLDDRLRLNGSVFYYDRQDVQQSATDTSGPVAVTRLTNVGDVEVSGAELDLTYQPVQALTLQLGLGYTDSELIDSDLVSATIPGMPESPIEGTNTPNYSKVNANFLGRYQRDLGDDLYGRLQLEVSYRSERDLNLVTNWREGALLTEPAYTLTNLRLGLGSHQNDWEVMLFVENLTDERYRTLLRDNGLRGMHTLYGDPRIWGASFTYHWGS
ncbi:TonB-dependent receptor [Parahaliea mediterranea]|uniref:TonB-dependent receptor n=1 Tax=Parahaliea mediterranea TaxID=651086 RepID=A0A939ILJ5_9GAMM|nr:TonB-dependent receptor [Parahaliea mediterranea]MBN7796560.1 TonB-dependent receptor [Parahaliea mediterranea]